MAGSSSYGPLLLEAVPINWHPLPLTTLTKKALMQGYSHYSNFCFDEKEGFVVEVPVAGDRRGQVPRATPATLKEHVGVHIRLNCGGNCSTHQQQRPLDECYSWWLGQLIHYGLPLELSADEAKHMVKTAMLSGELKVPANLKKMEQRMRNAANRRAKKMGVRLATKRSSSEKPYQKIESGSGASETEDDRVTTQTSTPRNRRQGRVKIEDETSSAGESDSSNDESSESSDSETNSITASPPRKVTTKTGQVSAPKTVTARSAQIKPGSNPSAEKETSPSSESDSDGASIEAGSSSGDSEYERAVIANSQAIEGASAMYGDTGTSSSDDQVEVRPIRQAAKQLEIKRDRNIRPEELEESSDDEQIPTPTPSSSRKRKRRSSIPKKVPAARKQASSSGTHKDPLMLSDSDEPISIKQEPMPKRRKTSIQGKRVALISDDIHGSQIDLVSPEPESAAETELQGGKRIRRSRTRNKSSSASEPVKKPFRTVSVEVPSSASKSHPGKNVNKQVTFPSSTSMPLKGILKSSPDFRPRDSLLNHALEATMPLSSQPRTKSPELPPQPPLPRPRKSQQNPFPQHLVSSHGYTTKSGFQTLKDQPKMRPSGQIEEETQSEPHRAFFPAPVTERNRIVGFSHQAGGGLLQRGAVKDAANGNSTSSKKMKHRSMGF